LRATPVKSGARFYRAVDLLGIASVGRCTQRPYTSRQSSLVDFISKKQTKETDENVGSLFLSGLQNFVVGGNRFINKSIYGKNGKSQVPLGTECR
jgi:hypothetical protein